MPTLEIYSEDGFVLRANMGYYIREPYASKVNPTSQDKAVYIPEFISTSRANNNCLVSIEEKPGKPLHGFLRSRMDHTQGPYVPNYSISETPNPRESVKEALLRGVKEELGCLIHPEFVKEDTQGFFMVVSRQAKDRIVNNYQRLVPITELYDVIWKATTIPQTRSNIVQDSDILESPLIADIDAAWATTVAPLPFKSGVPAYTSADRSYSQADHGIRPRPQPITPRQQLTATITGPPAPPPPPPPTFVSRSDLAASMAPSTTTSIQWPPKKEGETKQQYIRRVTGTGPGKSATATAAHAETLGFTAGRKTIRRKKSKHSKKRGTLKRLIRR